MPGRDSHKGWGDKMIFGLNDACNEASGINTNFEAFRFLKKTAESHGLPSFMVSHSGPNTEGIGDSKIIGNWPGELLSAYDENQLAIGSPVLERLRKNNLPFQFDVVEVNQNRSDNKEKIAIDIFSSFGMDRSIAMPVFNPEGQKSWIAFSGSRDMIPPDELMSLYCTSAALFQRMSEIDKQDGSTKMCRELSERELECMRWCAAGKTVEETAIILGLSPHTISHYLNSSMKKLSAVNRVQGVVIAMRRGLID